MMSFLWDSTTRVLVFKPLNVDLEWFRTTWSYNVLHTWQSLTILIGQRKGSPGASCTSSSDIEHLELQKKRGRWKTRASWHEERRCSKVCIGLHAWLNVHDRSDWIWQPQDFSVWKSLSKNLLFRWSLSLGGASCLRVAWWVIQMALHFGIASKRSFFNTYKLALVHT